MHMRFPSAMEATIGPLGVWCNNQQCKEEAQEEQLNEGEGTDLSPKHVLLGL